MKNDCLVTILHEFIVKCVWNFFSYQYMLETAVKNNINVNKQLIKFSGQLKMSLGSGSFLDVNTGQDIHASIRGLVPLVGWKMGSELVYFAEGKINMVCT